MDLEASVRHIGKHLDALDWEIEGLITQFNQPARHLAGRGLRAYWAEPPADRALGPAGIDWFALASGGGRKRVRRPQTRHLDVHSMPAFLPFQTALLERFAEYLGMREVARAAVVKLASATPRSKAPAPGAQESIVEQVARHRNALITDAAATVRSAGDGLNLVDAELDELMQTFNRLAKRPKVSIVCRWDVSPKSVGPLSGPNGPTFFFATASVEGRRLVRIKSRKGDDHNPVTTRELERAKYNQDPDALRKLADEITDLRRRRDTYIDTLKKIARAVSSLHRINWEQVQ